MNFIKLNPKSQVLLLLMAWITMGASDWFLRFYWFGWQRNWLRPAINQAVSVGSNMGDAPLARLVSTQSVPSVRGGDLTRLINIAAYVERFEQTREAYQRVVDSDGFYSPYAATQFCPVVVVGDSFMVEGAGWSNTFSGQLSEKLDVPVRNRGVAAKGAVMPLTEYLDSWQFKKNPPDYLVFGLLEREMTERMLAGGMVFQLWQDEHSGTDAVAREPNGRIRWGAFHPDILKWQLPNSSMIAKMGKDVWNVIRYHVFAIINPEVVVTTGIGTQGESLLCYRETIDLMHQGAEARGADQIAWALQYLNDYLERYGVKLVLVLIPDKAQVYREWLPKEALRNDSLPVSCLWTVEVQLRENNVTVVNLLEPYRKAAAAGALLYWRDDTHWNQEGIRLAAALTADRIQSLGERAEGNDVE